MRLANLTGGNFPKRMFGLHHRLNSGFMERKRLQLFMNNVTHTHTHTHTPFVVLSLCQNVVHLVVDFGNTKHIITQSPYSTITNEPVYTCIVQCCILCYGTIGNTGLIYNHAPVAQQLWPALDPKTIGCRSEETLSKVVSISKSLRA